MLTSYVRYGILNKLLRQEKELLGIKKVKKFLTNAKKFWYNIKDVEENDNKSKVKNFEKSKKSS